MDENYFIEFSKNDHTHDEWDKHHRDYAKFQNQKLKEMKNEITMIDYKKIIDVNNILIGFFNYDITSIILSFIIIEQIPLYVIETRGMYDGNNYELNSIHLNKNDVYKEISDSDILDYQDDGRVQMYLLNTHECFEIIKFDHNKIDEFI